jgi:hypothetical protein
MRAEKTLLLEGVTRAVSKMVNCHSKSIQRLATKGGKERQIFHVERRQIATNSLPVFVASFRAGFFLTIWLGDGV